MVGNTVIGTGAVAEGFHIGGRERENANWDILAFESSNSTLVTHLLQEGHTS